MAPAVHRRARELVTPEAYCRFVRLQGIYVGLRMPADTVAVEVLIVDDEPAVVDALDRALVQEGYKVASAGDGRAALDRVAAVPPDAVILDVSMPHMSGLEVCRRLRANGDRTPVLMLTARDQVTDRVAGLDAGADD